MRDDRELWEAWTAGDQAAGDQLVARYFVKIFRFFRGKSHDAAEELTQATFLACIEGQHRLRGAFRPYLFGIARNKLLQHYERRGRSVDADAFSRLSVADLAPSPSRRVGDDEVRAAVLQALQHIPVDHQIVIELSYWEELPQHEIAEALGIPVGTVKSRLARARDNLATELCARGLAEVARDLVAATKPVADALGPETD